jgi:hypothetical protein
MSIDSLKIPIEELYAAADRAELVVAMREFYAETDRLIAEQPATCWNKGECCRFGQFGHRLYVTALEVCYYLAGIESPCQVDPTSDLTMQTGSPLQDVCPHAHGGKCHVRDWRPMGCRVFYCDPKAREWQGPFTEERLARLRAMHAELHVPYFYADWMSVQQGLQGHNESANGEVDDDA